LVREYELVLMLDPEAPDGRRDEVAGETQRRIESDGALKHADTWGTRKLAYEIRQRTEADYRFFRFEGDSGLLEQLDHSLKITDGVLRFRVFKVDAGTPTIAPPPTAQPAGVSARAARAERRAAEPAPAAEEEAEPQPAAAEQEAEPQPTAAEPGEAQAAEPAPEPVEAAEGAGESQPAEPETEGEAPAPGDETPDETSG
jgi:small subunit ribosomal protein S6